MSHIIVTGITTGIQAQASVSELPQRLEWHDFAQNREFVTLYVNALQRFMKADQSEPTSFFQIAGTRSVLSALNPQAFTGCPTSLGTMLMETTPGRVIVIMEVYIFLRLCLQQW